MISKVFFSVLVALVIAQMALAASDNCPNPADAKQLVFHEVVSEVAPDFGRIQRDLFISRDGNNFTCITFSGYVTPNMLSLGLFKDGVGVKLVSNIKRGFYTDLEAYTK